MKDKDDKGELVWFSMLGYVFEVKLEKMKLPHEKEAIGKEMS